MNTKICGLELLFLAHLLAIFRKLFKKMKLDLIPKFWRNNAPAKSYTDNYWTDGYNLYSYKLLIGATTLDGQKILYDYTVANNNFISATTSRHVNLAAFYMDVRLNPGEPMCSNLLHVVTDSD